MERAAALEREAHKLRSLFREAAILYEKEGDSENYSACFWGSQIADAKRSLATFMNRSERKVPPRPPTSGSMGRNVLRPSCVGRPIHTTVSFGVVGNGHFTVGNIPRQVSFLEAVYFSFVTFTTVGYGDYTALGWTRVAAVLEALSGVFLISLFVVALTRRYLRMYR